MEDILVFQHDPLEELGVFTRILVQRNLTFRYVRLFAGEEPSQEWEQAKAVVVLGGPMSIHDEENYPFLRWEKVLIRCAIDSGLPVLGMCQGAHLIAAVAGGEVYRGKIKEIGWYPIALTPEGRFDPLIGRLPEKTTVFQWHADGFELPPGALRLASSTYYDNQAFRIGRNIYGLQFHLEVTPLMVEQWLNRYRDALAGVNYIAPDKIREDTRFYAQSLKNYAERFFSEFLQRLSAAKGHSEKGKQRMRQCP